VDFVAKIVLSVSLWIQYYKNVSARNNQSRKQPVGSNAQGQNPNSDSIINPIEIGSKYQK
jgi:hypothetical protein